MGNEAETYGYYEERELEGHGHAATGSTEYGGGGYAMNLAGPYEQHGKGDEERGRQTSRVPGEGANPFDDDAAASLRGVSPRPMEGGVVRNSVEGRRSAFREDV